MYNVNMYEIGPVTEASSVIVQELVAEAKLMLTAYGCVFVKAGRTTMIFFPQGSTRQELGPRTVDMRYRIVLPNGCELREIQNRYLPHSSLYVVRAASNEQST